MENFSLNHDEFHSLSEEISSFVEEIFTEQVTEFPGSTELHLSCNKYMLSSKRIFSHFTGKESIDRVFLLNLASPFYEVQLNTLQYLTTLVQDEQEVSSNESVLIPCVKSSQSLFKRLVSLIFGNCHLETKKEVFFFILKYETFMN